MEELWRIREDAKNKDNQMVRLRAEEDRGKMMGYYIDKKAILNVNKRPIDDMSLPELYKEMERIKKRNRHFMEKTKNEKNKKVI